MPPVKHYSSSEVNQYELSSRLLSLTENNTSYTLTQINGQRIYRKAPHAWSGPEPSRNCEVRQPTFPVSISIHSFHVRRAGSVNSP